MTAKHNNNTSHYRLHVPLLLPQLPLRLLCYRIREFANWTARHSNSNRKRRRSEWDLAIVIIRGNEHGQQWMVISSKPQTAIRWLPVDSYSHSYHWRGWYRRRVWISAQHSITNPPPSIIGSISYPHNDHSLFRGIFFIVMLFQIHHQNIHNNNCNLIIPLFDPSSWFPGHNIIALQSRIALAGPADNDIDPYFMRLPQNTTTTDLVTQSLSYVLPLHSSGCLPLWTVLCRARSTGGCRVVSFW